MGPANEPHQNQLQPTAHDNNVTSSALSDTLKRKIEATGALLKHASQRHGPALFLCGRDRECAVLFHLVKTFSPGVTVVRDDPSSQTPVKEILSERRGWITVDRQGLSPDEELPQKEWDDYHNLFRFSPLSEWDREDIDRYIDLFRVAVPAPAARN
ncbi:MAG: hypothetical protein QF586_02040 [Arenicellales bacterium]|jgi:hypothetical protein|nr:hypothetical protein [Arenicellales bacterium]MDP7155528.1 hypothetical protein [Arenicellales bacterium]MDP7282971.1 hypothetical protein [Arenicellales bacterium]MDP7481760.1 hypothetical protein [Arenicellales bacterium]HJL65236.1 hypothetical protein [Arenicellales bacterium]